MECNHRITDFQKAMQEIEAIKSKVSDEPGQVPCGGCTLCCRGDAIRILPSDDADLYKTVQHHHFAGQLMLAHKQNGDCVYLEDYGCSIHGQAPQQCREMDCRNLAKTLKKKDLKRYNLPLRVWERGRRMIGKVA